MSEESLKQVAAAISAKRTSLTPDEAKDLAVRALQFKRERGRVPALDSQDAWERRGRQHRVGLGTTFGHALLELVIVPVGRVVLDRPGPIVRIDHDRARARQRIERRPPVDLLGDVRAPAVAMRRQRHDPAPLMAGAGGHEAQLQPVEIGVVGRQAHLRHRLAHQLHQRFVGADLAAQLADAGEEEIGRQPHLDGLGLGIAQPLADHGIDVAHQRLQRWHLPKHQDVAGEDLPADLIGRERSGNELESGHERSLPGPRAGRAAQASALVALAVLAQPQIAVDVDGLHQAEAHQQRQHRGAGHRRSAAAARRPRG